MKIRIEHLYVGAVFCAVFSFFLYFSIVRAQSESPDTELPTLTETIQVSSSTLARFGASATVENEVFYTQNQEILRQLQTMNELLLYIARK